ncbi:MAG: MBL fold metallo-hydrolase [Ilyomonas sp.]
MKIAFHGAARTVTGSKHLITTDNGVQILLDCGMFQGLGNKTDNLNSEFGFDAADVNYLLLSHAHIDHSGLIPKLVKEGFKGKIFSTTPTKDLALLLLSDSADIQRNENNPQKYSETNSDVLYDENDVAKAAELFVDIEYNNWFELEKGIEVMFSNTGHILGSAAINIKITEDDTTKTIFFSGDVGRYRDVLLCPPDLFPQADYIIIESTYGNSLHEAQFSTTDKLMEWIKKTCVEKQGKLIIPSFSVGRTQELLYFLNQLSLEKRLPEIPVIVDSPLSLEATAIVKKYPAYFNERIQKVMEIDDDPFDFPGLHFTQTVEDSMKIESLNEPCVIIAASGMADAGRIRHHIKNNIESDKNTILLVGYCDPESLGGQLMNGEKRVKIFGKEYNVAAEIGVLRSMSAHGDTDDLCRYLSCQDASLVNTIYLVHGEYNVQQDFEKKLNLKGFEHVMIPAMHEVCGLNEVVEGPSSEAGIQVSI